MRRPFVAGNWKMNGTRAEASRLVQDILSGLPAASHAELAVCPPFILIPLVAEKLAAAGAVVLGAQNLSSEAGGAFTGEISGLMLRDYGCKYVIVGHSERRSLYGEDDETVTRKFAAALEQGLTPILCVGETLAEREADETEKVVARQLQAVLERNGIKAFASAIIAYEPVWAIGTGRTATPQQAQSVHAFIRGRLASDSDEGVDSGCTRAHGSGLDRSDPVATGQGRRHRRRLWQRCVADVVRFTRLCEFPYASNGIIGHDFLCDQSHIGGAGNTSHCAK